MVTVSDARARAAEEVAGPNAKGTSATADTMDVRPMYACIHVGEFAAQARLRFRPEQAIEAVAIVEGDAPFEVVCSLTARARRLGVQRGMRRSELDSFPSLSMLKRAPAEERAARAALMEAASQFTPRMQVAAMENAPGLFLVLDMTGAERLFGAPLRMAERIAASVRLLGMAPTLAVATNFDAAVRLAPFARKAPICVSPGREREALARLPLAALAPTEKQRASFALWGLETIGELAALDDAELVARLGQDGKRLRQMARGERSHLLMPEEPEFRLEERAQFDEPVELLDSLLFVLRPMLEQVLLRAGARALALASVTVRLALDGGGTHERTVKPALALLELNVWLKLLHLDLQAHPPEAGVVGIEVHAEPGARSKLQIGLFMPQLPEPARLDVTLARIAAMVGEDRVGRARISDTHRADGFVMERFQVPSSAVKPVDARRSALVLRRLRPPIGLHMKLRSAMPESFWFEGKRYCVQAAYGPWRTSGEWWTANVWSREEWDVSAADASGAKLLAVLVQDLLQKQWTCDGVYD